MKKNKNQNVTPELGADKDGMKQGGVVVEVTNPFESQAVEVKGNKALIADKKPVKATWY